MPSHFFCPSCWKEINAKADQCDYCCYDLKEYKNLSYEKKLINALRHPVRESRMIAAQILGDIKSKEAIPVFKEILETQADYYLIREIVISLEKVGSHESRILMRKMKKHQSSLVRSLVEKTLSPPCDQNLKK
jgi:HEAT repeat protein